jgi:hypothetical protein
MIFYIMGWNQVAFVQKTFMYIYICVCVIYIYNIYIYLLYIEQETSQRTVQLELEHGSFGDLSPTVCPFDLETCVGKKWTQSLLSSHPIWGSYPFLSCSQKLIPPVNKSFLRYRNHVWRNSTIMSSWLCIYIYMHPLYQLSPCDLPVFVC